MRKIDYHVHSTFSIDGKDTPEVMCAQALAMGYTEIAFTEHAEWHEDGSGFANVGQFLSAIEQCRTKFEQRGLTVRTGVEIGNPHEFQWQVNQLLAHNKFDITIGSLHHLDGVNIHTPQCFIGKHPYDVFTHYFTELTLMAANADFHILGHFDRILLHPTRLGFEFDPYRLESIIRNALLTIIRRDQMLEINTKYLDFGPIWTTPLTSLLYWYRDMGGTRIIINSDAHRKEDLGVNYQIAREVLANAGFYWYESHQPIPQLDFVPV